MRGRSRSRTRRPHVGESVAESGEVMVPTIIVLLALLVASTTLVSASEQWEARRSAAAAAATMARAAAQGEPVLLRRGDTRIDQAAANGRVESVVHALNTADGPFYSGRIVLIDGPVVTTEATVSVEYTFPLPGFPAQISGSARAEAVFGSD